MEHSFDIDLAKEIGIEEAIIFKHLCYWVQKNEANHVNFIDGNTWTFNSVKAFNDIFFYMTPKKIRNVLLKLESLGLIETGNYNKASFDRTKWYALTPKGKSVIRNGKCNFPSDEMHLPERENAISPKSEPIPDIYTDINTNINTDNNTIMRSGERESVEIEEFFNGIWKLYPKKKGKGQVSFAKKKKLYNLGYETVSKCIDRFVTEFKLSGKDEQFMMHGSTFFNSGYVDFLDENYNQTIITEESVKEPEPEEPINMFDVDDETYFRMRHGDAL